MTNRRRFFTTLPALAGSVGLAASQPASAEGKGTQELRFPGDPPQHRIVYQLNKADPEYIEHILNSIGAMLTKYVDNIHIVVVAFGPGIHLVGTHPTRPIPPELRQRTESQSRDYGVDYVACGNTMQSLGWQAKDIVPFARIEEVGAAAIMELQEKGYAYLAW